MIQIRGSSEVEILFYFLFQTMDEISIKASDSLKYENISKTKINLSVRLKQI